MGHDRWIDDLRAARADPTALAELLSAELPYDGLQHAGNATMRSLKRRVSDRVYRQLKADMSAR